MSECGFKLDTCCLEISPRRKDDSEFVMRLGEVWLKRQRATVALDGFFDCAFDFL